MKTAHLIFNPKSGKGLGAELPQIAQKICDENGIRLCLHSGRDRSEFEKEIDVAIEMAERDKGVVIAAGGDGTIRAVIQKAANKPIRVGVIAIGTFNFFARNHGLPLDPEEAARLALTGQNTKKIGLASINENVFLVNASLGIYSQAVRERELSTKRFGRNRLVVIFSTIKSFFNRQRLLNIEMVVDHQKQEVQTPMLFIGNNYLQLENLAMRTADCMKRGLIAVIMFKPLRKLDILRILFRGLTKTLEREEDMNSFCASSLTIKTHKKSQDVALDGEMFHLQSPLQIEAQSHKLELVAPP